MSETDQLLKRAFDIVGALVGLAFTGPVILMFMVLARRDTGSSGLFRQTRVGRHGRTFQLLKIRTMRAVPGITTTVTTQYDPRITQLGGLLRRTKVDELPQLWNVLLGDMSFVGPRPDVPSQVACLPPEDQIILSVRPGITGPASLKYREEEKLLAAQPDPEWFNQAVVFPDKVAINRQYIEQYSFGRDLQYLWLTFTGGGQLASPDELQLRRKKLLYKAAA